MLVRAFCNLILLVTPVLYPVLLVRAFCNLMLLVTPVLHPMLLVRAFCNLIWLTSPVSEAAAKMLANPELTWSFLVAAESPLRPGLMLPSFLTVLTKTTVLTTNAATAKHRTIILRGVGRVMVV